MDSDDVYENTRLLCARTSDRRDSSEERDSIETIVFDSKMMKTSTQSGDLAATWGGRRSLPDSGKLRRTRSWSAGLPDDASSEIRILRERGRQRLTLASLALVDFISFCSMSIMAPFFPREGSAKGLSDTMCGMVFSFYAVVMFLTSPIFGKYLPAMGAKFMFTSGMFVAGACNVLFGYVFVVNAFPDNIGSVLGILETFVGLGMSVGPAIGGLLYSIGGFGLPFYSLGIVMVLTVPINFFLLTDCEEYVSGSKSASILKLFKIPSIIITGLVIVIVSNTWAFLDPTLEPHLRQFGLSTEQTGLVFLLFSSLYGIFSPIWGWVADRDLWLDLVALSILGVSVALTLLPTFQGVLTSSIYEGGCPEALATYSAVAGVWSCCYSLGEVLGPAVGSALSERYGFPFSASLCAAACFTMAIVTLTFFSLRESSKWVQHSDCQSDSIPYTDSTWDSSHFVHTRSAPQSRVESSPLLTPCSCYHKQGNGYGSSPPRHFCLLHNKSNKSGSASVSDAIAYFLKFQYLTNIYIRIRKARRKSHVSQISEDSNLYQNYMENGANAHETCEKTNINNNIIPNPAENNIYCEYLEEAIFGSPAVVQNLNTDHLKMKKNKQGLIANLNACDTAKSTSDEIIKHNVEKVHFYEQSRACDSVEDVFDGCECKDGVTYVRGTLTVSSAGACEV
ncbi:putative synaptic vesicular amine transporter [Operophtera brumata]|uniref:Putative synaptic vesicular amine transporter n=1 Tax=Operophtera brumata TaxID=104452 RepID=A0A0L7LE45_OPEBR|nr:putative synaptic vesicular amine transporter [Operophtera brumata]